MLLQAFPKKQFAVVACFNGARHRLQRRCLGWTRAGVRQHPGRQDVDTTAHDLLWAPKKKTRSQQKPSVMGRRGNSTPKPSHVGTSMVNRVSA